MSNVKMKLRFSECHAAHVVTFGSSLLRLRDWPMFFRTRKEALWVLKDCGLEVKGRAIVTSIDRSI